MPVERTTEWVEREYGREKWPAIERAIDVVCDDEAAHLDLSRVVSRVSRSEIYGDGGSLEESSAVFSGRELRVARCVALGAYQRLVVDAAIDRCTAETDAVVELGSGWSRNLLRIWLGGGPVSATYVGAEFTDAGRRAAGRLAELESALRYVGLPFDYRQPSLPIPDGLRHAVVFTAHSIEQVPHISRDLLTVVRGIAPRVTCLHFEPVGWQVEGTGGAESGRVGSSAAYAADNDYNRDLVEMLRHAEGDGLLTIERVVPEALGVNPANSTSVIVWSSPAAAEGAVA